MNYEIRHKNTFFKKTLRKLSSIWVIYLPMTLKTLSLKKQEKKMMLCGCDATAAKRQDEYIANIIDDYSSTY